MIVPMAVLRQIDGDGNWIDEKDNIQDRFTGEYYKADGNRIDSSKFEGRIPAESARDALEKYGFADHNACSHTFANQRDGYDGAIAQDAVGWLQEHAQNDSPWFLAVNFVNPHDAMYFDSDGDGTEEYAEGKTVEDVCKGPPDGSVEVMSAPDDALYAMDGIPSYRLLFIQRKTADLPRSMTIWRPNQEPTPNSTMGPTLLMVARYHAPNVVSVATRMKPTILVGAIV